jgi:7-cyano-7-deazaguanine synthase
MDAKLKDRVELTFVPGRNATFLAIACGIAAAEGYDAVVTGVNGADNANYPDCTPEFIEAMENTMRIATRSNVAIYTPLQGMTKAAIVSKARRIPSCWEALAFTTTDYAGAYPPGNNHASVLREAGFEEAGLEDPLRERAKAEGLL